MVATELFTRLFGNRSDPREEWRALWHRTVAEARDPDWYRMCGVADSIEGRYDMITLVLTLVMLRLEDEGGMEASTARLTELFVEDMEGQMREAGIGDPTVGKKINALMESLNGRIGAYEDAFVWRGAGTGMESRQFTACSLILHAILRFARTRGQRSQRFRQLDESASESTGA